MPITYHEEGPLKPKKTRYRGILYRSRLEAKWAVFFDAMKIHYVYEPDIPRVYYIPDFILPHLPIPLYVEVKPNTPDIIDVRAIKKWQKLVEKTGFPLIILMGLPDYNKEYPTFYATKVGITRKEAKLKWEYLLSFLYEDGEKVPDKAKDAYLKAIAKTREHNTWDSDSDP